MQRRRNEDLFFLLADCPWWTSIMVAGIVYLSLKYGLPWYAADNVLLSGVAKGIEQVSGYFAALFFIPAGLAILRSRNRRDLLIQQSGLDSIRSLSWQDFEKLCGEAYRRKGYVVEENGMGGADGGIDLVLRKNGEIHLAQCKHWKKTKVGVKDIRELFGIVTAERAARGIFISSGSYTNDARAFSRGKPLDLIDGSQFLALIHDVQPDVQSVSVKRAPLPKQESQATFSPVCPRCGHAMQLRTAQRGKYKGQDFWGCSNFPNCREIVSLT